MMALAALAVGLLGMLQLVVMTAQSDRLARGHVLAMALAQDLSSFLQSLDFTDARLAVVNADNKTDPKLFSEPLEGGDSANDQFVSNGMPDHSDADLPVTYPGITAAQLNGAAGGLKGSDGEPVYNYSFRRYWNVVELRPGFTVIAAIVTFNNGIGGRAQATYYAARERPPANEAAVGGIPAL